MKSIGFCTISPKAKGRGIQDFQMTSFLGKICQIQDLNDDGDILALNETGTALGMFEKHEIINYFLCDCSSMQGVILPPNLEFFDKMQYYNKLTSRKGGYNNIIKQMVIIASLHKGQYTDAFLFQKENEENLEKLRKQTQTQTNGK